MSTDNDVSLISRPTSREAERVTTHGTAVDIVLLSPSASAKNGEVTSHEVFMDPAGHSPETVTLSNDKADSMVSAEKLDSSISGDEEEHEGKHEEEPALPTWRLVVLSIW